LGAVNRWRRLAHDRVWGVGSSVTPRTATGSKGNAGHSVRQSPNCLLQDQNDRQVRRMSGIAVSVQAEPTGLSSWLTLARRLESAGFHGLMMGDHPGSGASPWPALGSAAAVTQTLQLGTYVVQAGVREPMHVAADAATLDTLAPGRVLLGLGAGHTPREWADIGQRRPRPHQRAERLAEFVEAVAALLRGRTVTQDGRYLTLRGSRLQDLPVGERVRLAVGGGHPLILRAAARHAAVVALSGLGRTLPDGHRHEVRWSQAELHRQLQLVRDEARQAGNSPVIEALVQSVEVTANRTAAVEEISARIPGALAEDVARTPFLLIGSHEEMATQIRTQAEELGITSYVVREQAVPALERVLALIKG
jgi:probable F420-dependent oxidoreductase